MCASVHVCVCLLSERQSNHYIRKEEAHHRNAKQETCGERHGRTMEEPHLDKGNNEELTSPHRSCQRAGVTGEPNNTEGLSRDEGGRPCTLPQPLPSLDSSHTGLKIKLLR